MAIERIHKFRLTCDQCRMEIIVDGDDQIAALNDVWHWSRYEQGPGYTFHSMTCSIVCKEQWEGVYLKQLNLTFLSEIYFEYLPMMDYHHSAYDKNTPPRDSSRGSKTKPGNIRHILEADKRIKR